jgi:hypothetical protein
MTDDSNGLKIVCAWCKKVIKDCDTEVVSHGMCFECVDRVQDDIKNYASRREMVVSDSGFPLKSK